VAVCVAGERLDGFIEDITVVVGVNVMDGNYMQMKYLVPDTFGESSPKPN